MTETVETCRRLYNDILNEAKKEAMQELVEDMISIVMIFSAKLYGLRSFGGYSRTSRTHSSFKTLPTARWHASQ
jgi:predicted site-specific integrase-resolvase